MVAVAVLAFVLTLSSPPPASATSARYDVTSCNQSGTNSSAAWSYGNNDPAHFGDPDTVCTLVAQTRPNTGVIPNAPVTGSYWTFVEPANTTMLNVYVDGYFNRYAGGNSWWAMVDQIPGGVLVGCDLGTTACSWNSTGTFAIAAGASQLRMISACGAACDTANGFGMPWAFSELRGSKVRIQDDLDPTVSAQTGSLLNGWRRGNGVVSWTATDSTGIRRAEFHIDEAGALSVPYSTNWACDYNVEAPCTDHNPSFTVDTTQFINGTLPIMLRAWDAANVAGVAAGQVQDSTGVWGNRRTINDSIQVDNLAPIAPASVADGVGADAAWSNSSSTLSANWPAGSDPHSGVGDYRICFSTATSCGGTVLSDAYVVGLSRTTPAIPVVEGTTYFACVSSRDLALDASGAPGNTSGWRCSNGQRVDLTAPAFSAVNDGPAADIDYVNATTTLQGNWTAPTDGLSGVSSEQYCISTTATGGDCAGAAIRAWTAAAGTSVTASALPSLTNGTKYFVCIRAQDSAGNWSGAACSDGQTIDTVAPTGATQVSPIAGTAHAAWPALTATYTDGAPARPGRIDYQVCSDAACATIVASGVSTNAAITSGSNGSWTPATANGTYYWRAMAVDLAGNTSPYTGTRMVMVGVDASTISVDAGTVAMGPVAPTTSATATTVISVTTNAVNGYQVQASDTSSAWGGNQAGVGTVPDWSGTPATPTLWSATTYGAFGLTVTGATGGRDPRWGTGTGTAATDFANNKYAGLGTVASAIHARAGYSAATDTVTVAYRFAPTIATPAGSYTNSVAYTLVPAL